MLIPSCFFPLGKPSGSVGRRIVSIKLTENRLRWEVSVFNGFSNPPSVSLREGKKSEFVSELTSLGDQGRK